MKKKLLSVVSLVMALITVMSVFAGINAFAAKTITPPIRPTITKISPTINSVSLKFEYHDEDFQILVYRRNSKEGSPWSRVGVTKAGATSFTDTTVSPEKSYYYTIKAYYKDKTDGTKYCTKSAGDYLVTTNLAKPSFTLISNMGKGVVMEWAKRNDVTGYIIYRSATGEKGSWTKIKTVKSNEAGKFIDTKVNIGEKVYHCFKAYKTIGNKTYYSAASKVYSRVISGVTPPQNFKCVVKEDGVYITYDKVPGVLGYSIYRREEGKTEWVKIAKLASVNKLGFVDKTAEKGKTYTYTAKSYKTVNGKTTSSKSAKDVKLINLVQVPVIEFVPSEVTFKDYYEVITVKLKVSGMGEDDDVRIFIDGEEITDLLKNNEKEWEKFLSEICFIYDVDEKNSTDDTLVLKISRLAPGKGTLRIQHSEYDGVYDELKINSPELDYDKDLVKVIKNVDTAIEAIVNAQNLLEESLDVEDSARNGYVERAKLQLAAAQTSLEEAESLLAKYSFDYKKYDSYKKNVEVVDDYLDAVRDAVKDLGVTELTKSNIRDAIRELEAVK